MSESVLFVVLGSAFALVMMFLGTGIKRKPYLYVRNCLLIIVESLFFLSLLIGSEEINAPGVSTYFQIVLQKGKWWSWPLRVIVPLFLAFISILAAQLEGKAYCVFSSIIMVPALFMGLHLTGSLTSRGVLIGFVYSMATIIIGSFFFRYYLCLEISFVSAFMISHLISMFYNLSDLTMWLMCLVITVIGTSVNLSMLSREKKKQESVNAK